MAPGDTAGAPGTHKDPWGPGEGEVAEQDRVPRGPGKRQSVSSAAHRTIYFQGLQKKPQRSNMVISQVPEREAVIFFLLAAGELIFLED